MSPEQASRGKVDARSDIFSSGNAVREIDRRACLCRYVHRGHVGRSSTRATETRSPRPNLQLIMRLGEVSPKREMGRSAAHGLCLLESCV